MGIMKLLFELIENSRERMSQDLTQQISTSLHEWDDKSKISNNPWDRIVVAVMAEMFKTDLG